MTVSEKYSQFLNLTPKAPTSQTADATTQSNTSDASPSQRQRQRQETMTELVEARNEHDSKINSILDEYLLYDPVWARFPGDALSAGAADYRAAATGEDYELELIQQEAKQCRREWERLAEAEGATRAMGAKSKEEERLVTAKIEEGEEERRKREADRVFIQGIIEQFNAEYDQMRTAGDRQAETGRKRSNAISEGKGKAKGTGFEGVPKGNNQMPKPKMAVPRAKELKSDEPQVARIAKLRQNEEQRLERLANTTKDGLKKARNFCEARRAEQARWKEMMETGIPASGSSSEDDKKKLDVQLCIASAQQKHQTNHKEKRQIGAAWEKSMENKVQSLAQRLEQSEKMMEDLARENDCLRSMSVRQAEQLQESAARLSKAEALIQTTIASTGKMNARLTKNMAKLEDAVDTARSNGTEPQQRVVRPPIQR